jgi:hypothetical protein
VNRQLASQRPPTHDAIAVNLRAPI